MNKYKSFLAPQLQKYAIYRHNLGYSMKPSLSHLKTFDRYLKQKQAEQVLLQPSFFMGMQADLKIEPRSVNRILASVRVFFNYLVRTGAYNQNPLKDIPYLPENDIIPYIFSPEQVNRLLSAVSARIRKEARHLYLMDLSYYMAVILLARCGLRISEPLRLKINHYRFDEKTLYIEKTKFRKDRLIPVPQNALAELENYLAVRKALNHDGQNPYLLIGEKQKGLSKNKIYRFFQPAVKDIGLEHPRQIIGDVTFGPPRIHSLRHSFAINTLKRIKAQGKSPQHALPVLAAYMGHCKYQYTGAYLKVLDADHRQGLFDFARSQWDKI